MIRKKEDFGESILIELQEDKDEIKPEEQKIQSKIYEFYIQNLKKLKFEEKVFSLNDLKLENEEDRPYLILDKDNGKIFDIRNE